MFKKGDIIKIISSNEEGMILNIGRDIHTKETKFCICTNENLIYFVNINDIILVDNVLDRLEKSFSTHIEA